MIKSYRGLLTDGGQEKIRLTTTHGLTGYRIVKFQGVPKAPMTLDQENVLKIYRSNQSLQASGPGIDGVVKFTDKDLLAVCIVKYVSDSAVPAIGSSVIFDNETFNQDIYITNDDVAAGGRDCNYYIELEQIKLSTIQAELLIVKSLRGEVWTRP